MHSGGSTGPRARARRSTELDRPWGGISEVARLLRTDYKTLYPRMKQYGINAAQFRESLSAPSPA